VASLASYTRSAAQATSSAYRRVPIRWRLAGGSAALTLVILCGFAAIVGVLTTKRIQSDFNRQVAGAATDLAGQIRVETDTNAFGEIRIHWPRDNPDLDTYAAPQKAVIRVVALDGTPFRTSFGAPQFGPPSITPVEEYGWRIESRPLRPTLLGTYWVQYARRLSDVRATANRVKVFLAFGVLGGAALALLAGLATARRAMAPIAELSAAARRVARTRDPSVRLPHPQADDEVAELARTLEAMLAALGQARGETEAALARQREFVADASHELRTPLTSVLANLELLDETLEGEQREAAASALRSSRRMRRLVGDLLLLARADTGRQAPHRELDLSAVVTEVAAELEPVSGGHEITVDAPAGMIVSGARDELHRLALNLLENALRHTDPGTAVEASVERVDGLVVLSVEDDGPGVPQNLHDKVFERFFRGAGDQSGSSGLGLSIVRAVAESHRGNVRLEPPLDGRGARFVVRLPAAAAPSRPTRASGAEVSF
jgi:two-component system OmpR family sensor kinase